MIDIRRADSRYRTEHGGITSWHCFSYGAYFDPDNVAFGPLVACDEHLLAPGAGFPQHRHARVELVSWVLDGTLRHTGPGGSRLIGAGQAQYQRAGSGIEHSESNASSLEPVRFVQLWVMSADERPDYRIAAPPVPLGRGSFDVLLRCRGTRLDARLVHLFVGAGNFHVAGTDLTAGDSVRAAEPVEVDGDGELLVVTVEA